MAKRSSERLGHDMGEKDSRHGVRQGNSAGKPIVPEPSGEWHPVAQGIYKSLQMSGMAQWYETSDWALAWVMCETLHRLYAFGFSAGLLGEFNEMSSRLLMAEGDRRRARIELIRAGGDVDEDESETNLKDIRKALAAKQKAAS